MKELWSGIVGVICFVVILMICVGIVFSIGRFIYKVWIHVNENHNFVKEFIKTKVTIGKQGMSSSTPRKITFEEDGSIIMHPNEEDKKRVK